MRQERKNKRMHTHATKERVLMPGYLFLSAVGSLYQAVNCFGFESILSNGGYQGAPVRIPSALIEAVFLAEIDMQFDDTRAARIHRQEEARTRRLTVATQFEKGKTSAVASGPFAGLSGIIENVTRVELLLEVFGPATLTSLDPTDLSVGEKFPKMVQDFEYFPLR